MLPVQELQLTGTYQNMEQAIVEAIHLLASSNEYNDGSARSKDIYRLVRDATIYVGGQPQTGNHRFTIFSSALSGRSMSKKLFMKVKVDESERTGSWWKLKVPYEEALKIVHSLKTRAPIKGTDEEEWIATFETGPATKREEIRNRFMSIVPLIMMEPELNSRNEQVQTSINILTNKLNVKMTSATSESLALLSQLQELQKRIEELRVARQNSPFETANEIRSECIMKF